MGKYKVGDKFKILNTDYDGTGLQVGDIVEFVRYGSWEEVLFLKPKGGQHDKGLCFTDSEVRFLGSAKETAAEKRKVKFGDIGSLKGSLTKFTFLSDALEKNGFGDTLWSVGYESGEVCHYHPSNIRLDHEPEYKEIPFSEATHEQRMDHKNILWDGHSGSFSEVLFTHANTYILTVRSRVLPLIYTTHRTDGHTNPTGLTVRIPA